MKSQDKLLPEGLIFFVSIKKSQMEVVTLLFDSKYGLAAFASVTIAISLLVGSLGVLAHKANKS